MAVKHEALWMRWRQSRDLEARDRLVETYLWLIRYVAGRLMVGLPSHFDQGDVEGHGAFGLLEAVDRYDPARGVRFETFGIPWIRGACLEGVRAMQWAPAMRKRVRQVEKAQEALIIQLGREPTLEELASHLGLSTEQVEGRINEAGTLSVLSLDEALLDDEGDGSSRLEKLADPSALDPGDAAQQAERDELLERAIDELPAQERLVVSLFYFDGLLAKEISVIMNLSPARISQIHSRAILRLRGKLARMKAVMVP